MRTEEQDPGLTTETALLLTVLLGGFALKEPVTASALAVTVAIALMARTRIHHFIRDVLSEEELTDVLSSPLPRWWCFRWFLIDTSARLAPLILERSGRS